MLSPGNVASEALPDARNLGESQGRPVSRILLYPAIHLRGDPGPLAGPHLPAREARTPHGTIWLARTGGLPGRSLTEYRRWALTPPFHPSPVPRRTAAIGWSALCCT